MTMTVHIIYILSCQFDQIFGLKKIHKTEISFLVMLLANLIGCFGETKYHKHGAFSKVVSNTLLSFFICPI